MIELLPNMTNEGSEGHLGWFENRQLRLREFIKMLSPVNLMEIGFNMGHSCKFICDTILEIKNSDSSYMKKEVNFYVFDICYHEWMEMNFNILQEYYKNYNIKLNFIKGSTPETLEPFLKDYDGVFDFIEVDGSHVLEIAHSDMLNVYNKIRKGGLIYVDDYTPTDTNSPVVKAVGLVDWSKYDIANDDDIFFGIKII